ncbi:MAG: hypothetical protein HY912_02320 [Desulfomonile tiedjei]|uniref:SGNH hydrolase-type esterase domain-containing protein n=1 Tax=Desulfomonile tiedjei TaxID=2358 RepID=A0A9D6V081_9BACT|nr:hypothetical protein [Desulfomonile tiedjei]
MTQRLNGASPAINTSAAKSKSFAAKRLFSALAALLIGLVLAEVLLRTISLFAPGMGEFMNAPQVIKDATLEYRFPSQPSDPGAGVAHGNSPAMAAKLVAIGDSITYGSGVPAEEAWPRVLEAMSRDRSFRRNGINEPLLAANISCPGYGPVHYVWLQEEALRLNPDIMVATFYLGNDIFDAFHLVDLYHFTGQIKVPPYEWPLEKILDELGTKSQSERQETADLTHAVVPDNRDALALLSLFRSVYTISEYKFGSASQSGLGARLFKGLIQMSAYLYPENWYFDDGLACTTFSFKRILGAMNLEDPWMKTGFHFSMEAYRLMKIRADKAGVRFCVLVIPTKHTVFRDVVGRCTSRGLAIPASYFKVIENEDRIREASFDFFRKSGIAYVDALPALKTALEQGAQPYKISVDNHPNAHGQAVIAKFVLQTMEGNGNEPHLFDIRRESIKKLSQK